MVETLSNLKNGKIKRAVGQSQGGETVERLKKFLSGLNKKRHGMYFVPFMITERSLRLLQFAHMSHCVCPSRTFIPRIVKANGGWSEHHGRAIL